MFLGFLSRRTFKGFCTSYLRFCVRSYVRNILVRNEKVARWVGGTGASTRSNPPSYLTNRAYLSSPRRETPRALVSRVTRDVATLARRAGDSNVVAERKGYEAARGALARQRMERGYGDSNHTGGKMKRSNPAAVTRRGGLRGGVAGKWR